ncbi:IclR family transcriptional regulator [Leifsonia shinshuensis]
MSLDHSRDDAVPLVKSASRTLEVLEALAGSERKQGLPELSKRLSIPKSSLHGILKTMVHRGWVETDESGLRFGLGVHAVFVGTAYIDRDDVVARAQSILDWLSDEIGETVHLGRSDGADVVYLAKRDSTYPLRLYSAIGRRLPLHATALGKALLAGRSPETVRELLPAELVRLTPNTITRWGELEADLEQTRQRGYAVDDEENSVGIHCFAIALPNPRPGRVPTDAISISVPHVRLVTETEARCAELLAEARARYAHSERLGHVY